MIPDMKSFPISRRQIFAVILFLLFVLLVMDLNNRVTELFRLTSQRDTIRADVVDAKRTEQAYVTRVAYATSDAAVADWAYEDAHKSLPGDNMVKPQPEKNYTPPAPTVVAVTPVPVETWEVWRALFFGE